MKLKSIKLFFLLLFPFFLLSQNEENFYDFSDRNKLFVEINSGLGIDLKDKSSNQRVNTMPSSIRLSFGFKVNRYLSLGLGGGVDNFKDENFPYYFQFNGFPVSTRKIGLNYVLRVGALVEETSGKRGFTFFHPALGINFNASKRKQLTLRLGFLSAPRTNVFGSSKKNRLLMLELGVLLL